MRPLVFATPKESRDRAGTISPAVAGLHEVRRDAWALHRGLGEAAVILVAPEGSANRSGPVTPTASGGVRVVEGEHGPAWRVFEGTTNLHANPAVDTGNGWGSWSARVTHGLDRDLVPPPGARPGTTTWRTTLNRDGAGSATVTVATGNVAGAVGVPVIEGQVYTATIYVRHDSSISNVIRFQIGMYAASGTYIGTTGIAATDTTVLPGGWQRVRNTFTVPTGIGAAAIRLVPYATVQEGGSIWATMAQVEQLPYMTEYADGAMGAGHTWAGTPNRSASTRAFGTVAFTVPAEARTTRGAVALRYRAEPNTGKSQNPHILYTGSNFNLYRLAGNTQWVWSAGANSQIATPQRYNGGTIILEWDGDRRWMSLDDDRRAFADRPADWTPNASFTTGPANSYSANGEYEGIAFFDRPLTGDEREHLRTMPRAWAWGEDGSISIPVAATPGEVYVRYRRKGVTLTSRLTEPGPLGDVAEVAFDASGITITAAEDIEVLGVLAYEAPLPPYDRLRVQTAESWAWDELARSVSPIAGRRTGLIRQTPKALVTIDGIPTPAEAWRCRHGVEQPIGSATITVPVGAAIEHIRINAPVEIQAGYEATGTQRVFLGTVKTVRREASIDGVSIRLECEGTTARLAWTTEDELVYRGRTRLRDIFVSFAEMRGLEQYLASRVTFPNGTTDVAFGGIAAIDDGDVVLKRRTSPLTWLTSKADLFGYRVFGTGAGPTRLQRVSGLPSGSPVASFTEGVDLIRSGADRSKGSIVTNWTVYGARYTDDDGVPIEIRAIPAEVPPNPDVMPPGYVSGDESDSILTTQALVNAVRQVREIDHSEASEIVTWETWGRPELQPGDVIEVTAPAVGVDAASRRWLMTVEHQWSGKGFTTILEGWAGAGSPLPAGIDETIIPVGAGPYRLGDEYLPHYVIPSAGGRETVSVPFTVPGDYTSLALTGRQHGTNSYLMDGVNTDASVSKLEVWQGGERVGSADLPVSPENLNQRLPYQDRRHWTTFRMPIPGRLEEGPAEMRIVSGRDNRAASQFALDDFEIENLAIEARGTGRAILPGRRT